MILAEQGHTVDKWVSGRPDPVQELADGSLLWDWLNWDKSVTFRHARDVADLEPGRYDVVVDNIRAQTWQSWGVDPAAEAVRLGVRWVSLRDDFDGRSFDAVAQARAWGDHTGYIPVYIGDTAARLWLAFKALAGTEPGHFVVRQAAALAKLVEGEAVVPAVRDGVAPPWDAPGTYGRAGAGVRVEYRGETVSEPFRDDAWRRSNLRNKDGRYEI
jgi:hypothetical protein